MSLNSFTQEGQIFLNFEDIASQEGQRVEDFGLDKKSNLTDEMGSAWSEAKIYWEGFTKAKEKLSDDKLTTFTRERWIIPLLQILGYKPTFNSKAIEVAGKQYVLSHSFDENPDSPKIHIVKFTQALDKKQESLRFSPHAAMQNFLNDHEGLWGVVTNGLQIRLLRDSTLIGHSSYLEINLEQIMSSDGFAEFMVLYRILHRSRFSKTSIESDNCWLEKYFQTSLEQGGRVREALSFGVEKAIKILGSSLLFDENNKYLQDLIEKKELDASRYYRSILNLIYKMLFLMVSESRNLLFVGDDKDKKRIYDNYYSFERLRELSEVLIFDSKDQYDLWESFKALIKLLDENSLGGTLGLGPVDGGLFSTTTFELLNDSNLKNEDFLDAIRELSLYEENKLKKRVNYSALDVEELGSVYEGLLEYHPIFEKKGSVSAFTLVTGSERKSTASYYTGADLVEEIIASTLDPLIEEKRKTIDPEKAILSLRIIDPACGSGHFLLAATRRIAKALSEIRAGEDQPTPEAFRHAKREVIANCIHGVDLNPLAVDLCKVALWIEGYESGRPLSFLDHKIKCGNSLIGIFSLTQLEDGIPTEAYTAIASDNKKVATALRRQNENELIGFQNFLSVMSVIPKINLEFTTIQETVPNDVHRREQEYFELRDNEDFKRIKNACDLWTGAFFSDLSEENRDNIPTTNDIKITLQGEISSKQLQTTDIINKIRPLHWPIEFPNIVGGGGFDAVIGNPPWEKIKLQEKEFFSSRDPVLSNAINTAERKKLIIELKKNKPELYREFELAKFLSDKTSQFLRKSLRFPLTAQGDINTFAIFAENFLKLLSSQGRAGIIVPSGIATDYACKEFFGYLVDNNKLLSLFDFENREAIFKDVHRMFKFSLLSIGSNPSGQVKSGFLLTRVVHLKDKIRIFNLNINDYKLFNPNTKTSPIFRTKYDYELTKKIYQRTGVLVNEKTGENHWGISFNRMFDISNDSNLFLNAPDGDCLPLYEGKLFWQYDHRYSTFFKKHIKDEVTNKTIEELETRDVSDMEKADLHFEVTPRYWVNKSDVDERAKRIWDKKWFIGFRRISNATQERTSIFSIIPYSGISDSVFIVSTSKPDVDSNLCLLANFNSIVLDFIARQKVGGINMSFYFIEQFPVLDLSSYSQNEILYVSNIVKKLYSNSFAMLELLVLDAKTSSELFDRKFEIAKLDAFFAKKYGLSREELSYILDPVEKYGDDFPGETFRILKANDLKNFGEYKTKRLTLEAWDDLEKPESASLKY
jgi:hypothetical protein